MTLKHKQKDVQFTTTSDKEKQQIPRTEKS